MREAEMVGPGVSAISPSGGRLVADRYPTTLAAGEVAPEAVMLLATLGSTLAVERLRLGKTEPGSACKSPSRRPCRSNASSARAAADRIVDGEIPRLGLSIMLTDRYGLLVSTTSSAARDVYVEGCEAKLTMYPGAIEAFDRAIAADPSFALAHAAKAHALLERGDAAAARASMAAANSLTAGLSAREASHVAFFDLLVAGNAEGEGSFDLWPGGLSLSILRERHPMMCREPPIVAVDGRKVFQQVQQSAFLLCQAGTADQAVRERSGGQHHGIARPGVHVREHCGTGPRTPARTSLMRRAIRTRPVSSWDLGSPPHIRATACYTAI
jgi:hypothetical protein